MDGAANECLWLVHNGVPFDVAFNLDEVNRRWMSIRFSTFHGAKFDTDTMRFEEKSSEHT